MIWIKLTRAIPRSVKYGTFGAVGLLGTIWGCTTEKAGVFPPWSLLTSVSAKSDEKNHGKYQRAITEAKIHAEHIQVLVRLRSGAALEGGREELYI